MPIFKTTLNILKIVDQCELYNENWMDSDKIYLPPNRPWDYNREMTIEDVDIWEVLYEASGGVGVYAAWSPYADFYMITTGWKPKKPGEVYNDKIIETYYGANSQKKVYQRTRELKIPLPLYQEWVDEKDIWLHNDPTNKKIITGT